MAQIQTASIRRPDEDFQWLLSLEESNARMSSEKSRALRQRPRREQSECHDADAESLSGRCHPRQAVNPATASTRISPSRSTAADCRSAAR